MINAMDANVGSNLQTTNDPRYYIVKEPRWCADCIQSKTKLLKRNYPVINMLSHFDVVLHAKEKGWVDGRVASLSTPISVCNEEFPQIDNQFYMPPKPFEPSVEELMRNIRVEDNEEEMREKEELRKEVKKYYEDAFRLGMKFEV
jgi:hypothetical protein